MSGRGWGTSLFGAKSQSCLPVLSIAYQTVALPSCLLKPELFINQRSGVRSLEGAQRHGNTPPHHCPLISPKSSWPQESGRGLWFARMCGITGSASQQAERAFCRAYLDRTWGTGFRVNVMYLQ